MQILEHLFLVGEFPERAHLLSSLTLEQVRQCPEGASHSIYDELWHAAGYQRYVLERGIRPATGTRAWRRNTSSNGTTWCKRFWTALGKLQRWGKRRSGWRSRSSLALQWPTSSIVWRCITHITLARSSLCGNGSARGRRRQRRPSCNRRRGATPPNNGVQPGVGRRKQHSGIE